MGGGAGGGPGAGDGHALGDGGDAGGIHYDVPGSDKEGVLRAVAERIAVLPEQDPQFIFQVLLAREALGSTGIGDGIAIPHVRNPIVLHTDTAALVLCFLEHPIDFGAVDGRPVFVLFTLVSPTVRVHLHLLSRLSYMLREPGFRGLVQERAPAGEILSALWRLEAELERGALAPAGGE